MSLLFWAAYDSRDNIVQSIILIIVGIIFGTPGIIIILKDVQNRIMRKDKK